MTRMIIYVLSTLRCSYMVLSSGVERRQITSSYISVPTFDYGYYSDVYPKGELTTKPTASVASPTTVSNTTAAVGAEQSSFYGPVGVSQEEAFIASMCEPINKTNQPDLNFPCNKLLLYEAPCLYGKGYEELLRNSGSDSLATPVLQATDQFKCFCAEKGPGHDYWQNSV
ncbi:MAG: hypothetical protein Q9213_007222 [Squamulea squamosa]